MNRDPVKTTLNSVSRMVGGTNFGKKLPRSLAAVARTAARMQDQLRSSGNEDDVSRETPPVAPPRTTTGTGKCVVVVNQKGGVGKTTTAVSLGASLAAAGCRTLLADLDPQANATAALAAGLPDWPPEGPGPHGIYAVLCGQVSAAHAIRSTKWTPLSVLPATVDLAGAEVELADDPTRRRVRQRLTPVLSDYDVTILDTPPSLGILTVNCLAAADFLLIPVQCEYFALEGLRQLLKTIDLVRQGLNPELQILGLLRTMHDGRTNLSQQVAAEIAKFFPGRVFETVVPRNVRLSEAPSFGQPISQYAPACPGAAAYRNLAQEVARLMRLPYEEEEPHRPRATEQTVPPTLAEASTAAATQQPSMEDPRPQGLSVDELLEID